MRFLNIILAILFLSISHVAHSQNAVLDVNSFEDYRGIQKQLKIFEPGRSSFSIHNINLNHFKTDTGFAITRDNFSADRFFLLQLSYTGIEPHKTVYFFPGKMVNADVYFFDSTTGWNLIDDREAFRPISISSSIGLVPMQLKKGQVQQYLIFPELHYYNWSQWYPTIAHQTAVNDLILKELIQPNFTYSILTILMAGMMFMLFSYSFLKFYLNRRKEYLYNSLFGLSFLLYFAVIFTTNFYFQNWFHQYAVFAQHWLQAVGFIFQFIFIIRFLELRKKKNGLFLFLRTCIFVLMAYCSVLPFITLSDLLYSFSNLVYTITSVLFIGAILYTAIALHNWNRFRARFVAFGLFSLLSFIVLMVLHNTILKEELSIVSVIGGPVILYHAGILAILFFFRLGLGQKERAEEMQQQQDIKKLQLENEKKELEKVLAIASSRVDERNRIAKEIHDDIGSGLTSIRLLSEIALVKQNNKDELNKISANANELVNNLNEIIWSINSKNDTLPNLAAYIRSHMVDYLEPYSLKLTINIPQDLPSIELSGEKRRNIFMVIKECFTNIVKHANATAVSFTIRVQDELIFMIQDNGKGFDDSTILPFKNGIRNMRERIEHLDGTIDISGNKGTTITVRVPLNGNDDTHL